RFESWLGSQSLTGSWLAQSGQVGTREGEQVATDDWINYIFLALIAAAVVGFLLRKFVWKKTADLGLLVAVVAVLIAAHGHAMNWNVPTEQLRLANWMAELEEERAKRKVEVGYAYVHSTDFSDERDKKRPLLDVNSIELQPTDKQRELSSELRKGEELIATLLVKNKGAEAVKILEVKGLASLTVGGVQYQKDAEHISKYLPPYQQMAIHLGKFPTVGNPFLELIENVECNPEGSILIVYESPTGEKLTYPIPCPEFEAKPMHAPIPWGQQRGK
ncbi:MAG: hypothetical protein ACE5JL_12495, partial [Dehalococcoidia bacterium]